MNKKYQCTKTIDFHLFTFFYQVQIKYNLDQLIKELMLN